MTPHPSLSLRSNATFSRWRRLIRTVEILVDLRIILIRQTSSATFPNGEGLAARKFQRLKIFSGQKLLFLLSILSFHPLPIYFNEKFMNHPQQEDSQRVKYKFLISFLSKTNLISRSVPLHFGEGVELARRVRSDFSIISSETKRKRFHFANPSPAETEEGK